MFTAFWRHLFNSFSRFFIETLEFEVLELDVVSGFSAWLYCEQFLWDANEWILRSDRLIKTFVSCHADALDLHHTHTLHLENLATKSSPLAACLMALCVIVIIFLSLSRVLLFLDTNSSFFQQHLECDAREVERRKHGKSEHLTTQKLGTKKCLILFALRTPL